MTRRANNKITYTAIAAILLAVVLAVFSLIGGGAQFARAATSAYSDVLTDLQRDEDFKQSDYPLNPLDYSVDVITIAESETGELFIYAYHPAGQTKRLIATSINISTTIKQSLQYDNYNLEFLSSYNTLYKYKVCDFEVKKDAVRYYDISSIYRKFDSSVDLKPDNDNTVSEIAYPVGQFWTVCTVDNNVTYSCEDVEVIEISAQTVGFRRYSNGINVGVLSGSACDAHYFAFSTKRDIERLISADIGFYTRTYEHSHGNKTYGERVKHFKTLYYDEFAENPGGGWLGKKNRWDRIASTADFLQSDLNFKDEERELFKNYQWVINFYESSFDIAKNSDFPVSSMLNYWLMGNDASYVYDISGEYVQDVTLMRLEFEFEGKVYNLGVVSNKQTGSGKPVNAYKPSDIPGWVWALVIFFAIALVLILLSIFVPGFSSALGAFFRGLGTIIAAPFKAISAAIKRRRERKAATAATTRKSPKKRKSNAKKKKKRRTGKKA